MEARKRNSTHFSDRTELLIGSDGLEALRHSHVLVIGLGGVGGYAVEMLARSGVGMLSIVDADIVHETNINRQLIAFPNTIGEAKVQLWHERLLAINPELQLVTRELFIRDEATEALLHELQPDYVIDAIDTLSPKVHLIKSTQELGLPFVSVMGMGAMLDPTQIRIARMDKAKNCPLAKMIRKRLRKLCVSLKFPVIYSEELPMQSAIELTDDEQNKKSITGTIAYNPAVAGCYAAYKAIDHILQKEKETHGA